MKTYSIQPKPKKKFKKVRVYLAFAMLYLLLLFLVWLFFFSPVFQIKKIEFQGAKYLEESLLLKNLRLAAFESSKESLFKLLPFENAIFWKSGEIVKLLPQQDILIGEASSSIDFFKRSLKVNIQERKGEIIWCQLVSSGSNNSEKNLHHCFWVDRTGIAFREAPFTEGTLFNRVDDSTDRILTIGSPILEKEQIEIFFTIKNFLDSLDIGLYNFNFSKPENQEIEAILANGPKFYFCLRSDPSKFLRPVLELKKDFSKINYIDLRVENRIYYKP